MLQDISSIVSVAKKKYDEICIVGIISSIVLSDTSFS